MSIFKIIFLKRRKIFCVKIKKLPLMRQFLFLTNKFQYYETAQRYDFISNK